MIFTGPLSRVINPKWLILTGHLLMIIAGFIFPFANSKERYWPYVFPAFTIGSAGAMLAYQHGNIAIFRSTPPRIAGTVGAMYNSALQLGSSVGAAIITSIETSIEKQTPTGRVEYQGRAAAFWFLLAVVFVEAIAVLVFYRPRRTEHVEEEEDTAATVVKKSSAELEGCRACPLEDKKEYEAGSNAASLDNEGTAVEINELDV